ncbi:MAG: dihydroorotase family protein [Chloroflexota bacterium]|nr:dihydroorotase family protein [Chloroflexota bacterium]
MKLIIRRGQVVTPAGHFFWDVVCEDGRIAAVQAPGIRADADEEIDARGMLVFPGFIDPHVHSRDPGATEKEDFAHSTRAAAAGGITSILEMPNAIPPLSDVATFRERAERHGRVAFVDFGLWAISLGAENLDDLPGLLAEGAVAIKLFWGYALHRHTKQLVYNLRDEPAENLLMPPDNAAVFDVFQTVARAGGLLAAHCEDRELLEGAERSLGRDIEGYQDLLLSRPETAEAASIALGIEFARGTGCRFHVVHVSSARGLQVIRSAQRDGTPVSAETCPHYLTLTDASYATIGPLMKVFPPVRRLADQEVLWEGLRDGTISSVGSDHAPHTIEQKQQRLARQPAGVIGIETLAPVMLNEVMRGRLSAEQLAWVLSEGTARLYGLYPRKGTIQPGADADLTLVDPDATWTIRNERLHSKQPLSPWNGAICRGAPRLALLRGNVIMRDGEPVGEPRGRLIRLGGRQEPHRPT